MGRFAFAIAIASASWAMALALFLESKGQHHQGAWWLVGPLLMTVLPPLTGWIVFGLRVPVQRFLTACACVPFAFTVAFLCFDVLYDWDLYGRGVQSLSSLQIVHAVARSSKIGAGLAALAVVPSAPILFFGLGGIADDQQEAARFRIGAALALSSLFQLGCVLYVVDHEILHGNAYFCVLPPLAALAFGVFEAVKARLVSHGRDQRA